VHIYIGIDILKIQTELSSKPQILLRVDHADVNMGSWRAGTQTAM